MSQSEEPKILVHFDERDGGGRIGHITIDNAQKLNTLNTRLMTQFVAACGELARDDRLRGVVVTGAGDKAFVGGADVGEMAGLDPASARAFITLLHRSCEALRELHVPVIARINGYALGGGLELAASCDIRVAAETAVLGMPEVRLGIPSVIEAALLPSLVGWGRAREMLFLGETLTAAQAAAWGLVERVVPADQLDEAVESCLRSILRADARAIRLQKALIRSWEALPLRAAVQAGIDAFATSYETDAPRRAMQAFLSAQRERKESRRPN